MIIDDIINDIYDTGIENPKLQQFMRSVIKAWLRDAFDKGFDEGQIAMSETVTHCMNKKISPRTIFVAINKEGI